MGSLISLPGGATPIERVLSRFDRRSLESFITVAIDLLDIADGDADKEAEIVEPNGDEMDASWPEGSGGLCALIDRRALDCEDAEDDDPGGCQHDDREPDDAL